jgi:tripartite-type tricarboxylate transporter receptor subunit TctC
MAQTAGLIATIAGAAALAGGCVTTASAQQPFYQGKQITLVVGSAPGGGYDLYARMLVRHWPEFIPGKPNFVVQNMDGAGSLVATNFLANTAPRDGTTIGGVQNHMGFEPLLGMTGSRENVRFKAQDLNWIGSAAKEVPVVVVWHETPIKTFDDTFKQEVLMGSSGIATSDSVYANVMNAMLGTKFKVITGYKSQNELSGAMERGEIAGRAGWFVSSLLSTRSDWIRDKKARVLVQVALEKHPAFPDVPLVLDWAKTAEAKPQLEFSLAWLLMGRPYVAPPKVPKDRVKLLRDSFMETMKSPGLLAEAKKLKLDISPMSGAEIDALLAKYYTTPPDVIEQVRKIVAPGRP